MDGATGKVSFDESGDRINAEYHVMNVYPGGALEAVGQYLFSMVTFILLRNYINSFIL